MAARETTEKKPRKPKTGARANEFSMPDGSILDTSTLDVGMNKITEKETRFVFFYTFPGTDAFQCMAKAAACAGYKDTHSTGYKLCHKPNVAAAIKYVMDAKVKIDLEEEFHKILELKKRRVHYDIGEYVKKVEKTITVGKGEDAVAIPVEVEDLKDLEELTPEQRSVIDGIDYKGMQAVKVYEFADRDKAMADIMNLYNKAHGVADENAYDVELTAEIIKGNLSVKVAARKKKEDTGRAADFVRLGEKPIEEL
jgi:phage terminase small subunit